MMFNMFLLYCLEPAEPKLALSIGSIVNIASGPTIPAYPGKLETYVVVAPPAAP